MATHSSIPAELIPRTQAAGGLQSMGLQRVGHNWADAHTGGIIEALREAEADPA